MSNSPQSEIQEVVLRYCRGVDRGDMDLVRSAYHPDAVDHHTGFDGGVDEFVEWLTAIIARFDGCMHHVGNHLATISGDRAVAETYIIATHWGSSGDDPTLNFTVGTRYIDLMECRDGRWGIIERWAAREFTRSDAGLSRPKGAPGPSGSRGPDDPLAIALGRLVPQPSPSGPSNSSTHTHREDDHS